MTCSGCGNTEARVVEVRYDDGQRQERCNACAGLRPFNAFAHLDRPDFARDQHNSIKWMANLPEYHPNHIDDHTAARWNKMFVQSERQVQEIERRTSDKHWKPQQEQGEHEAQVLTEDRKKRSKEANDVLAKLDHIVRTEGIDG